MVLMAIHIGILTNQETAADHGHQEDLLIDIQTADMDLAVAVVALDHIKAVAHGG
jgi:hypothetical protein